jgi:hypothetical protein
MNSVQSKSRELREDIVIRQAYFNALRRNS